MERPIAVIAFGGNAILDKGDDGTFETQLEKAKAACREMLSIMHRGYDVCLVHGNGPQVGNLLIQFEKARDIIPVPPLDVAVASSQGLLGHMLEVSMRSVLAEDKLIIIRNFLFVNALVKTAQRVEGREDLRAAAHVHPGMHAPEVVGVDEAEEIARSVFNADVARLAWALVFLVEHDDSAIASCIFVQFFEAPIG